MLRCYSPRFLSEMHRVNVVEWACYWVPDNECVCMDVVLVCVSISPMYTMHEVLCAPMSCVSLWACDMSITNPGACPFSPEAYNILWKNKRVQVRKKRSSPIRLNLTLYNPNVFNLWQCFDSITGLGWSSLLYFWSHVDVRINWIQCFLKASETSWDEH